MSGIPLPARPHDKGYSCCCQIIGQVSWQALPPLLAIAPLVIYNVTMNGSAAPGSGAELNDKVARSLL